MTVRAWNQIIQIKIWKRDTLQAGEVAPHNAPDKDVILFKDIAERLMRIADGYIEHSPAGLSGNWQRKTGQALHQRLDDLLIP